MWDSITGNEIARLSHDYVVTSVSFSPDGKLIASGSYDSILQIWDFKSSRKITRIDTFSGVNCLSFSPDGENIASGGYDGVVNIWDVQTGISKMEIRADFESVQALAFSPDGKYLLSGGKYNSSRVWEVASGREISKMNHEYGVTDVSFNLEGNLAVSSGADGTVKVWNVNSGEGSNTIIVNTKYSKYEIPNVKFSSNGKYFAISETYDLIHIWDAISLKEISKLDNESRNYSFDFSLNEEQVFSGSKDDTARIWDINTGQVVKKIPLGDTSWITFSPNGEYIISADSSETVIHIWDSEVGIEIGQFEQEYPVRSAIFTPEGKNVASIGYRTIYLWALESGIEKYRISSNDVFTSLIFSPDGETLASISEKGIARLWNETGAEIADISHGKKINTLAFSPT